MLAEKIYNDLNTLVTQVNARTAYAAILTYLTDNNLPCWINIWVNTLTGEYARCTDSPGKDWIKAMELDYRDPDIASEFEGY